MKTALAFGVLTFTAMMMQQGRNVPAGGRGPKVQRSAPTARPAQPQVRHDVASHLARHPDLATRIQPLVPTGMTVDAAAAGFKNTGQFIAALHVSKNLEIPFADLKARMTGPEPKSLGDAVRELKPDLPPEEAKKAADEASRQAKADQRGKKDRRGT